MCDSNKNGTSKKNCDSNKKPRNECSKLQKTTQSSGNILYSYVNSMISNCKKTVKEYFNNDLKKPTASKELLQLISTAEKLIKDFYDGIVKKVMNFADNDLGKFKTMSKEEAEKSKKILLQYAGTLQKISEEKLKKMVKLKEQLQTKILCTKELHSIGKFFDVKITEVKKLTEEIYKSLSKGETINFVTDLQKVVETQSKTLKTSLHLLFESVKENIPNIKKSVKLISSKDLLSKMPTFSDTFKLLSVSISKILVQKKPGCVNGQEMAETVFKKPMVSLRYNFIPVK